MKSDESRGMGYRLPLLPLRDIIVFPHMVVPLYVGREKSLSALEEAMAGDKQLLLAAQRRPKTDDPSAEDIFAIGTVGHIIQLLRFPKGPVKVLVEGRARARIRGFHQTEPFFVCDVEDVDETDDDGAQTQALMRSVQDVFDDYAKLNTRIPPEMLVSVRTIEDAGRLADTIVAHVALKLKDKQELLETPSPLRRLERLGELMQGEIEIRQVEKKLRSRVKKQMEKQQKEFYLNEQMQAIQKELGGERDEFKNELNELEQKIKQKKMSKEAKERCLKELKKLKQMSPMSAEATVVRNYLDWVIALPWEDKTEDRHDINEAERILEAEHYGLKKVKERILEYLAVQALVPRQRGPILCLVGPPGVGKTSLARSIAHATGRKFVRQSLGGVRDEAEIRGHRRTYIGALPGKVIQSLKKVGSQNPVFLLDEIDKMSMDFRGDPASALLEVLDPEQNNTFNDHYLDLDYDLSDTMFVTTANQQHAIPLPLQDRLEIIELPGYTEWEKLAIARQYLIPKQEEANGLRRPTDGGANKGPNLAVTWTDDALITIIHRYTKEAGVRSLEREVATVCRKIAKEWLAGGRSQSTFDVTTDKLTAWLGVEKYREARREKDDEIGLANGLAVTMFGGDLLTAEVTIVPGKGKLTLTGKLGEVMQESAQAAMSYLRSRAGTFGLSNDFQNKVDVHVHFPEGAIPKDGPSAGITMATAMASALLRIPVRQTIAMTGEVTLRGRVLPIGGLKEKILAAHRAGVTTVLIPDDNKKDMKDVPESVLEQLAVIPVKHMDEVLRHALAHPQPEAFLQEPSSVVDWRIVETMPPSDPRDAH
ncbi:MAG: endopeptidase La [Deltaproteobacteria bacterium]|nr:endopeptidase La [Deltaproteobacteria bacterium]MCW5801005.1 endopeptidase La [Deltaproteobacteria bacterium]